MKHKFSDAVREYCRRLSDNELRQLHSRLTQRVGSDLADALDGLQKSAELDNWLSSGRSAGDLYDYVDAVEQAAVNETRRRMNIYGGKVS